MTPFSQSDSGKRRLVSVSAATLRTRRSSSRYSSGIGSLASNVWGVCVCSIAGFSAAQEGGGALFGEGLRPFLEVMAAESDRPAGALQGEPARQRLVHPPPYPL